MLFRAKHFYDFGSFRLDLTEKLLLRDGKPVPLTPKVFETLQVLVENAGRLVEKDELMRRIWEDRFVEESNLTFNVKMLRKALGDDAHNPHFIETVPKRGYRFVAEIREIPADDFPPTQGRSPSRNEAQGDTSPGVYSYGATEEKIFRPTASSTPQRRHYLIFGGLTFIAIILAVGGFSYWVPKLHVLTGSFHQTRFTRITSSGNSYLAAISPNGEYVVYAKDEGDRQSLWVRQTDGTRDVEIVPSAAVRFEGVTVAPDSRRVFYTVWDVNRSDLVLYQVPMLGGTPQKLSSAISSAVTFSPDGRRIAFASSAARIGNSHLLIANADGSEEVELARRKSPDTFETFFGSPAWSPDGKSIVAAGASMRLGVKSKLIVFNVADGSEKPLTEPRWSHIGQVVWLRSGDSLLMVASADSSSPMQIWQVAYPSGEARLITNDLNDYRGLSVTADSKTLVTTQIGQTTNLWVSSGDAAENARAILSETGTRGRAEGLAWTPDGKIVFRFNENGRDDIWQMDKDGGERKQLTIKSGNNIQPTVCARGSAIVFASKRTEEYRLWRADRDGGNPQLLTTVNASDSELYPHCAPDGDWVVYQSGWRRGAIWKVPVAGGQAVPVVETYAIRPAVSPDGQFVAYYYLDDDVWGLAVTSIEEGTPLHKFPLPASVISRFVRWTPDGQALAYIDSRNGVSNIWLQPLSGKPPRQLTTYNTEQIFYFDWSGGGKHFAVARGTITSDVISISNLD